MTDDNKLYFRKINLRGTIYFFLMLILVGCVSVTIEEEVQDGAPVGGIDWNKVKYVTPKYEPKSNRGNPPSYEQFGRTYYVLASADNYKKRGVASWYGTKFHGRTTSSGEVYDMMAMTAAHKTLPIPCYARVTNLENGKQIIVKINDRGPFVDDRIIDLSYAAAHKLEMTQKGTALVEVETITFSSDQMIQTPVIASGSNSSGGSNVELRADGKQMYVQVGAYSVHKTAQKLAKVLDKEIRLPVKITSILRNGTKLYRVRIGPIPHRDVAEDLIKVLNIKELGKPQIIFD